MAENNSACIDPIDELLSTWSQYFEISDGECRQRINKILRDLLKTLEIRGEPFFLPLDNDYAIMVEKESEKALRLTKIQFT